MRVVLYVVATWILCSVPVGLFLGRLLALNNVDKPPNAYPVDSSVSVFPAAMALVSRSTSPEGAAGDGQGMDLAVSA